MKLKSQLLSLAIISFGILTINPVLAKEKSEPEINLELFLDEGYGSVAEELGADAQVIGLEETPKRYDVVEGKIEPLTKGHIKTITQRVAKELEAHFFTRSHVFWPAWDTSKLQILLVNQSSDFAYLLNNQNPKIDKIGARIEYSARTLENNEFKVSQFGMTKINGIDTYYYNVDTFTQFGRPTDIEYEYISQLTTAVHEAVHLIAQNGTRSLELVTFDQSETGSSGRGQNKEVDIAARYFRNEVGSKLVSALRTNDVETKQKLVRHALYFQDLFLKRGNQDQQAFDYSEGMAEYVAMAFMETKNRPKATFDDVHAEMVPLIINKIHYEFDPRAKNTKYQVINQGREYYDLGGLAYAVAFQLGHKEVLNIDYSPLAFLKEKYSPLKTDENEELKQVVDTFYSGRQKLHNARYAEIDRVMNDPNSMLIEFETDDASSSVVLSEMFNYHFKGQEGTFEIKSQELKFGDNRIKLNARHSFLVFPELPEQLLESEMVLDEGFEPSEEIEFFDSLPIKMILPVRKSDMQIKDGRLTVQTESLVMFDVKFKKNGRTYTLVKS